MRWIREALEWGCMSRKLIFLVLIGCLTACMSNLWGQGAAGTLNGTILDSTGAVVPGAAVVAINADNKAENKTTSTSAGAYTLPYLVEGSYTVTVSAPGFRKSLLENVVLRAAQTLTVNVTLEVGQVTEQVTVSDTPPLLEAGTAEVGRYISQEEFNTWPILTSDGHRQIQEFIFDSLPGTTGGTFQGSINGGQQYSHEIMIDGIALGRADLSGGNNDEMSPSLEAIGDFKLQTGAVSAEYNGGQTAIANYSIKSGTNSLHGSAYNFLQNEDFDSVGLGNSSSKYRLENWGYTAGGPVMIPKLYNGRNKTFWFSSYEHTKVDQLTFSGYTTVSPLAYRTGDFSGMLSPSYSGQSEAGSAIGTDALGRPVVFGAIYDPSTTRSGPGGAVIRDPFPGNIIPTSRIDPVAASIIGVGLVPPTLDSIVNNIQKVGTCCPLFDEHIIGIKVDQVLGDKNRIAVYYNQGYRFRNNTSGQPYLPIEEYPTQGWHDQLTPSEMGRVTLTTTVTSTLINNLAIGYGRFYNGNGAPQSTIDKGWADKIGIQNTSPDVFPAFYFSGLNWQGGSIQQIGVGGYNATKNGSETLRDSATKIWGRHTFHFGYQYARYFFFETNYSGSGNFYFSPLQTDLQGFEAQTGNSFASFMLGAVNHANNPIAGLNDGFYLPYHASWLQDDIKITPKLTMNVGFRWEIMSPFYERTDRMSWIDLAKPDPNAPGYNGPLVFGNTPAKTFWGEIGPRFGLAYQVNPKMVVRAGYSMMNTPPLAQNWGFSGFTTGYSGTITVPAGTNPDGFVQDPVMYLHQPFPNAPFTLPDLNPADGHFNASSTAAADSNRPGYVQNYNVTIQYLLPQQMVVEAAYVGNHGTRVWGYNEYDVSPATKLAMGDTLLQPVSAYPQYLPYAGFPTSLSVAQAILPYPQYYAVNDNFAYNTSSNYNSLQVTLKKNISHGMGFLAAYTFSKVLGYQDSSGVTGYGVPQDFYNRSLEYGLASFNQTHVFKFTASWDTPFGKNRRWDLHKANLALGGWQVSALLNYGSGFPISVAYYGYNTPTGFGSIRPDITSSNITLNSMPGPGSANYQNYNGVGANWLNPASFAPVPMSSQGVPLSVGTAPRNLGIDGYPYINESFRLSKIFPLWNERIKLRLGATVNNPFLRQSTYLEDNGVGDSNFGQVLSTGAVRTMQLEGHIEW